MIVIIGTGYCEISRTLNFPEVDTSHTAGLLPHMAVHLDLIVGGLVAFVACVNTLALLLYAINNLENLVFVDFGAKIYDTV